MLRWPCRIVALPPIYPFSKVFPINPVKSRTSRPSRVASATNSIAPPPTDDFSLKPTCSAKTLTFFATDPRSHRVLAKTRTFPSTFPSTSATFANAMASPVTWPFTSKCSAKTIRSPSTVPSMRIVPPVTIRSFLTTSSFARTKVCAFLNSAAAAGGGRASATATAPITMAIVVQRRQVRRSRPNTRIPRVVNARNCTAFAMDSHPFQKAPRKKSRVNRLLSPNPAWLSCCRQGSTMSVQSVYAPAAAKPKETIQAQGVASRAGGASRRAGTASSSSTSARVSRRDSPSSARSSARHSAQPWACEDSSGERGAHFLAGPLLHQTLELARIGVLKREILHFAGFQVLPRAPSPQDVPAVVCRDLVQPGGERTAGVVLAEFLPKLQENLHGGVLGVL